MADSTSFTYDSEVLSQTASLKLQAINLVEGLLSGQHKSPHKGSSIEFTEYKDYSPGDDIRHIDWKVVAKTDRYLVKQFEQVTNLKCNLLLDASGSMAYDSPMKKSEGMRKKDYARTLVAALSYLLLRQFDSVGLTTFNEKVTSSIPPRSKPSHFQHLLHGLETTEFNGITGLERVVGEMMERLPRRSLVILVSDFLCRDDDVMKTLKLITSRGLELIVFHVLHPDEMTLPFDGDIVFESLEDDPSVGLDPAEIRQAYQQEVRDLIDHFEKSCPTLGIDYQFLETTTPLEQALRYYLLKRKSLKKS